MEVREIQSERLRFLSSQKWFITHGVIRALTDDEIRAVLRVALRLLGSKFFGELQMAPNMIVIDPNAKEDIVFEDEYPFSDGKWYPITAIVRLPISRKVYVKADYEKFPEELFGSKPENGPTEVRYVITVLLPDEY
jgi:hypothetical protein